eukprot:SAG31_NODE_4647_length_3070_cov_2.252777_5_plen_110_part_00
MYTRRGWRNGQHALLPVARRRTKPNPCSAQLHEHAAISDAGGLIVSTEMMRADRKHRDDAACTSSAQPSSISNGYLSTGPRPGIPGFRDASWHESARTGLGWGIDPVFC